jgi:transcriptional regulator with XRE-family HTH domain
LTQEQLADLSGLHRTYIWGIEQGRRNPSLINIVRIADALGLKVGDLFE